MRAVIAPMVADRTFYEAIPGLADRLPPALQKGVEGLRCRRGRRPPAMGGAARLAVDDRCGRRWRRPSRTIAPMFPHRLRRPGARLRVGLHSHVAESKAGR